MTNNRIKKSDKLAQVQAAIAAVIEKYQGAPGDHQVTAILATFVSQFNHGDFTPEMVHEAWEELYEIGFVLRDDFKLRPLPKAVPTTWVVIPMAGESGEDPERYN